MTQLFMPSMEYVVLFTIIAPLFGVIFAQFAKSANLRDGLMLFTAASLFGNVVHLFFLGVNYGWPQITLTEPMPGISISFNIEPLGMIFALVASFLWLITTLYSIGYMRGNKEANQSRFYTFFAIAIFATMGIAFAGNLFTLFLFYEMLTLSTYPLVTHAQTEEAKKAGRVYLGILLSTSIGFFLVAIIWTYYIAGTGDFVAGGILSGKADALVTGALLFLYVFGVGKAAVMPLHRWLPVAMVAPTPVSALLHAVAVVKAGVFTLLKVIVYIFGTENLAKLSSQHWYAGEWLVYVAGTSIVVASLIALRQDSIKRMLAYSTISQLSYITMAASLFTGWATIAAAFHIAAHAVSKITLFFAAGSIYTASKKTKISQLDGIGKQMPVTMVAFSIGALSMIGLPPAAGLITKFYILSGALSTEKIFVVAVLLISTVLNAMYFLPIIYRAFFLPLNGKKHGEAPVSIQFAMFITAALTVGLFFLPSVFIWLASLIVHEG